MCKNNDKDFISYEKNTPESYDFKGKEYSFFDECGKFTYTTYGEIKEYPYSESIHSYEDIKKMIEDRIERNLPEYQL